MPSPCNPQPIKWVSCCQIIDCLDIKSSDNSVTVEKSDCGIDIRISSNNIDNILKINDGDCISFVKEFIDGVLNFTPIIDIDCLAPQICEICTPISTCPAPLFLSIENV